MAYSPEKNQVFFQRCKNVAKGLIAADEEISRLIEYHAAQVSGHADFTSTTIATTAELAALKGVMDQFKLFMAGTAVSADATRRAKLMPFLSE